MHEGLGWPLRHHEVRSVRACRAQPGEPWGDQEEPGRLTCLIARRAEAAEPNGTSQVLDRECPQLVPLDLPGEAFRGRTPGFEEASSAEQPGRAGATRTRAPQRTVGRDTAGSGEQQRFLYGGGKTQDILEPRHLEHLSHRAGEPGEHEHLVARAQSLLCLQQRAQAHAGDVSNLAEVEDPALTEPIQGFDESVEDGRTVAVEAACEPQDESGPA